MYVFLHLISTFRKRTAKIDVISANANEVFSYFYKVRTTLSLLLVCISLKTTSQSIDIPLGHQAYEFLEKTQALNGVSPLNSVKPFSSNALLDSSWLAASQNLQFDWRDQFIFGAEVPREGRWRKFYSSSPHFFSVREDDFKLNLNPIWQFNLGYDQNVENVLFTNSRGLELTGIIDERITFKTSLTENQIQYAGYIKDVADSIGLIPREGFWKEYNGTTTDFFRVQGHVDISLTKNTGAQLGFGRHFIGNGERSMLLSDFSNSYPYLRITTDVWKFKYTNIFASLIADVFTFEGGTLGSRTYPKKYMAAHYLEIELGKKASLGLFESVIIGRADSLSTSRFKPEYFNPVIFYRALEQQEGSPDNVLLGLNGNWTPFPKLMFYGQFLLDELIIGELTAGNNWWGNKYGFQIGAKYFDLFQGFDLVVELNGSRPFTYGHADVFTSYTHYLQPLAHPFGANFTEYLLKLKYQPISRLMVQGVFLNASYGVDDPSIDFTFGKNPNLSYNLRDGDYDHLWKQGIMSTLSYSELYVAYELKHNLFLDLKVIRRSENFENSTTGKNSTVFSGGFRWNIVNRTYWF